MNGAYGFEQTDEADKADDELTVEEALANFRRAWEYKQPFVDAAKEDVEFALGKQWEDDDFEKLMAAGVRPLTINKIRVNITLLKGIESQNRSEFRAFPEGAEDTAKSEIATRLMKNSVKDSELDFKTGEIFEDGNTAGESHLEPYIHYPFRENADGTIDLTGRLCFKKRNFDEILWDPLSREYNHDDAGYFCNILLDITKGEMLGMFPDKKAKIDDLEQGGKINISAIPIDRTGQTSTASATDNYGKSTASIEAWVPKDGFDLLKYCYKRYVPTYFVADFKAKVVKKAKSKAEAEAFVATATKGEPANKKTAKVIERFLPEIWVAYITGNLKEFLFHGPEWSFPRWKGWSLISYYAHRSSAPLDSSVREFAVQGLARPSKDLNRELNKRRTQELRILNTSANSGFMAEDGSMVDEKKWEDFGASPGIILKYKAGKPRPTKIEPTPLSQGHAQLAEEHKADMKETIGISTEVLAMKENGPDSGRAIALRQKQGLVMVQCYFDNLARTRRQIGRFILSQLKELYTVETASRVLGEAFLNETFQKPVMQMVPDPMRPGQPVMDPKTNQPVMAPVMDEATGEAQMEFDQETAVKTINEVLNDAELGNYDVAVGDNISSETVQFGNFQTLLEMSSKGVPIPPDVLVEESTLSEASKKRITSAIQRAALAGETGTPPKR